MISPIIDSSGVLTRKRCTRSWFGIGLRRAHDWMLRGRRTQYLHQHVNGTRFDPPIAVHSLRFECRHCGSRTVLTISDPSLLWQLDVEIPEAEAPR